MQKTKNTSMMIALLLVLMAGSVGVSADGSDHSTPLTEEPTGTETV